MSKGPGRQARSSAVPPATISASEFKATCLELMDDLAARGAEIIVTKHGRPVVRVGPVGDVSASLVGFMRGTIVRQGDVVGADMAMWRESATDPLLAKPAARKSAQRGKSRSAVKRAR